MHRALPDVSRLARGAAEVRTNILNELSDQGDRPTSDQHARAVRRMKRDRATIRRLERECAQLRGLIIDARHRAAALVVSDEPNDDERPSDGPPR